MSTLIPTAWFARLTDGVVGVVVVLLDSVAVVFRKRACERFTRPRHRPNIPPFLGKKVYVVGYLSP